MLALIGLRLVWIGLWPRRPLAGAENIATVDGLVLLGGGRRSSNSADFRGGDLMAVMGGFNVDLRNAKIANGPAVIDVFAFWGGIDIKVPEDWAVTVRGIPLLGGFDDKTQAARRKRPSRGSAPGADHQGLRHHGRHRDQELKKPPPRLAWERGRPARSSPSPSRH